jgi:hypothetical protein
LSVHRVVPDPFHNMANVVPDIKLVVELRTCASLLHIYKG